MICRRRVEAGLSERDERIIRLVARFELLTTSHLALLGLQLPRDHSSVYRVLSRLTKRRYLAARPQWKGGVWGGSSEYVYRLGPAGRRFLGLTERPRTLRSHQLEHTLEVNDAYADLKVAEWQGGMRVLEYLTEPACDLMVGSIPLRPDAHVELEVAAEGAKVEFWFEVDRGTESRAELQAKYDRYWRACSSGQWPRRFFPYVLFIVPDVRRRTTVEAIIRSGAEKAQPFFHVCLAGELVESVTAIAEPKLPPSWLTEVSRTGDLPIERELAFIQ